MKIKQILTLLITPLLLTSCAEKTFEKKYMQNIKEHVSPTISKFEINNYPTKTVGLGNNHYYKEFNYVGDIFNETINKIIPNSDFYSVSIGEGFYNPNFVCFYNELDETEFNIMIIKETLCSSKYFTDRYCYYLFYKEKESDNKYYLGASKDISVYNDLIYLHDIAVKNTYGDPMKHEC